jgi:hypothetical protein
LHQTGDDYCPCRSSKQYYPDTSKYIYSRSDSYEHQKHSPRPSQPPTPSYKHVQPPAHHYYNKQAHHYNDIIEQKPPPPPAPISKASYHDIKFERKHNRFYHPIKTNNYPSHQPRESAYHHHQQRHDYITKPPYGKKGYYVKYVYVPVNYDILVKKPRMPNERNPFMSYHKPRYETKRSMHQPSQSYLSEKYEYKSQPRYYAPAKDYNKASHAYKPPTKRYKYNSKLYDSIKNELVKYLEKDNYDDNNQDDNNDNDDDDDDEDEDNDDDDNHDEEDNYSEDDEDINELEDELDNDIETKEDDDDKNGDTHVKITNSNENFNLKKKLDTINEYKSTSANKNDYKSKKHGVPTSKTTKKNVYRKI